MNRKRAIILYAVYSVVLVLIISFATSVSTWIMSKLNALINPKNIDDVKFEVITDGKIYAKDEYDFTYEVEGNYRGDPGIVFESMNTDPLGVNEAQKYIKTNDNFDGSSIEVDIKITSKYDKDFEKVVTLLIEKKYPEIFKAYYAVEGCGYSRTNIPIGSAIHPYPTSDEKGISLEFEILYDSEYIRYDEQKRAYIPIKETEEGKKLRFTIVFPNGASAETSEFAVVSEKHYESFDEIRVKKQAVDSIVIDKDDTVFPIAYTDDKAFSGNIEVSCDRMDGVKRTYNGYYLFKEVGDYVLTMTLPNGFSKSLTVHVRNNMSLPTLVESANIDGKVITVGDKESTTIKFKYPSGVTFYDAQFEYDSEMITVKDLWRGFSIKPHARGETELKVIFDDGYQRLEDTYTVKVVKDTTSDTYIRTMISDFVSKVMGHTALFAILAVFTINLFRYVNIPDRRIKLLVYLSSVFPTAIITEVIQIFQPNRHPRVKDVFIDFLGFLIGTAITVAVIVIRQKRRATKADDAATVCDDTSFESEEQSNEENFA